MNLVKPVALAAIIATGGVFLAGCSSDANVVSENISKDADNFKINRRIVFYNGITDKYMLEIEGFCNIDSQPDKLAVTCKTGPDAYKKHYMGKSDNMSYLVEQLDATNVSPNHYEVVFKPETIVPTVQVR